MHRSSVSLQVKVSRVLPMLNGRVTTLAGAITYEEARGLTLAVALMLVWLVGTAHMRRIACIVLPRWTGLWPGAGLAAQRCCALHVFFLLLLMLWPAASSSTPDRQSDAKTSLLP